VSARIRSGARFKRFLCFVLIDAYPLPYACPMLKTIDMEQQFLSHKIEIRIKLRLYYTDIFLYRKVALVPAMRNVGSDAITLPLINVKYWTSKRK
jgi:hypothetical protein